MCIIATKPVGKALFSQDTIELMFSNNHDGAGYMYADRGKVRIKKGFMTVEAMLSSLKSLGDVTNVPMVLHFRIGTHGGNTPANTHPFPISDKVGALQAQKVICDLGMVHNGIIRTITPRAGISDTMEYILAIVNPLRMLHKYFYTTEWGISILETTCKSKLAFLDAEGRIVTVGEFKEDDGYFFSNDSYKPKPKPIYNVGASLYSYDDCEDYAHGWYDRYKSCLDKAPKRANTFADWEKTKKINTVVPRRIFLSHVPAGSYIQKCDGDIPVFDLLDPNCHCIDPLQQIYELCTDGTAKRVPDYIGLKVFDAKDNALHYNFRDSHDYLLGGNS